jgi:hypothetical protein
MPSVVEPGFGFWTCGDLKFGHLDVVMVFGRLHVPRLSLRVVELGRVDILLIYLPQMVTAHTLHFTCPTLRMCL